MSDTPNTSSGLNGVAHGGAAGVPASADVRGSDPGGSIRASESREASTPGARVESGVSTTHVARSNAMIAPDAIGPAPYFMQRAARVVDVTTPPGFEVGRVAFATRLLEIEAGDTVAAALAREPYEAEGGQFVIVGVRNRTGRPTYVEATIHVENERGPIASAPAFRIAAPGSPALKGPESGGGVAGPREPRPTEPRPSDPRPVKLTPPAVTRRRDLPPAPPAEKIRSSGPVKRSTGPVKRNATERRRAEWKEMLRAKRAAESAARTDDRAAAAAMPAATAASAEASAVSARSDVSVVVALFRTYATALHKAIAYRAQLPPQVRMSVARALRSTLEKEDVDGVIASSANEVEIVLDRMDAERLTEALRLNRERFLDDTIPIVQAIATALGIAPPETPLESPSETSSDAPAIAVNVEAETEDDVTRHDAREDSRENSREDERADEREDEQDEDVRREASVPGTPPETVTARPVPDDGRPE